MRYFIFVLLLSSLSNSIAFTMVDVRPICEQSPGLADSHVLALSWQPGFCETYGYEAGKPECLHINRNSYHSSHLVLHGLWPNQNACGQHYGYCGVEAQVNHCDYSPLNLNDEVAEDLRILMPSYAYGSCLERHEWNKHGSCQILSNNSYFSLALRLVHEVDASLLGQFLHENVGTVVNKSQLLTVIDKSFGKENHRKVYLGCKNGLLVDVFIELPALIPANESLVSLINKAPEFNIPHGCSNRIKISNFNKKESWF